MVEGVLPYLSSANVRTLLDAVRTTFEKPMIVGDMTTLAFARRHGKEIGERLRALGAPYGRLDVEPLALFESAGFRRTTRTSIVGTAMQLGLIRGAPSLLMATLFRSLRDGYTVSTFERA